MFIGKVTPPPGKGSYLAKMFSLAEKKNTGKYFGYSNNTVFNVSLIPVF